MRRLEDLCFVKISRSYEEQPLDLSLHKLICDWCMEKLDREAKSQWSITAAYVASLQLPAGPVENVDWQMKSLPIIRLYHSKIQENVPASELESPQGKFCKPYAFLAARFGQVYLTLGFVEAAESMLTAVVQYQRVSQKPPWPADYASLEAMIILSIAFLKARKVEQAAELLDSLYKASTTVAGYDDETTVWAAGRLRDIRESKNASAQHERQALISVTGGKSRQTISEKASSTRPPSRERMRTARTVMELDEPGPTLKYIFVNLVEVADNHEVTQLLASHANSDPDQISDREWSLTQVLHQSKEEFGPYDFETFKATCDLTLFCLTSGILLEVPNLITQLWQALTYSKESPWRICDDERGVKVWNALQQRKGYLSGIGIV